MADITRIETENLKLQEPIRNFFKETQQNIKIERREFWRGQLSTLMGKGGKIDEVVKIVVDKETEADYDSTGAFTQVGLLRRISGEEIPKITREHLVYSVLLLDMDNLRIINETQGHDKGTESLVRMVETVGTNIRPGDLIGRWTKGDEFVILLIGCNQENAVEVKKRINNGLNLANIKASIGVASGDSRSDFLGLVKKADNEMYREKQIKKQAEKTSTL